MTKGPRQPQSRHSYIRPSQGMKFSCVLLQFGQISALLTFLFLSFPFRLLRLFRTFLNSSRLDFSEFERGLAFSTNRNTVFYYNIAQIKLPMFRTKYLSLHNKSRLHSLLQTHSFTQFVRFIHFIRRGIQEAS